MSKRMSAGVSVRAPRSRSRRAAPRLPTLPPRAPSLSGSKQLRKLRRTLEENRLTMPLFDTKGWVADFEKALKIQWEIYANGLSPMHIVVARSERIYGSKPWTDG